MDGRVDDGDHEVAYRRHVRRGSAVENRGKDAAVVTVVTAVAAERLNLARCPGYRQDQRLHADE